MRYILLMGSFHYNVPRAFYTQDSVTPFQLIQAYLQKLFSLYFSTAGGNTVHAPLRSKGNCTNANENYQQHWFVLKTTLQYSQRTTGLIKKNKFMCSFANKDLALIASNAEQTQSCIAFRRVVLRIEKCQFFTLQLISGTGYKIYVLTYTGLTFEVVALVIKPIGSNYFKILGIICEK